MPACFGKMRATSSGLCERHALFHAREKERGAGRARARSDVRPASGRFVKSRRPFAGGSPATAIERRCTGDRRSTARVAWESQAECHAMMETMSRPPPRPPPQDDTLALASARDRRGAWVGVASDLRRLATWLPHHAPGGVTTAESCHATPHPRGLHAGHAPGERRPVCPRRRGADAVTPARSPAGSPGPTPRWSGSRAVVL
jgi:hypothetical protein